MKKAACFTLMYFLVLSVLGAQPWVYDFGTGTGAHTATGQSFSLVPSAPSGTCFTWVRDNAYGAGVYLENPGLAPLGSGSELRINAANTTNLNKFSNFDSILSKSCYIQFDMLLGGDYGETVDSGQFYFLLGTGPNFSNQNGFFRGYVFSSLKWTLGAGGAIISEYCNYDTWSTFGSAPFSQSNVYRVEIYANNSTSQDSYTKNGGIYYLDSNKQDIWVNGTQIGDELNKAQLANDTSIDSFMFYALSSSGSVGNIFLDNIVYAHSLPKFPATQASNVHLTNRLDDQVTINWTAGSGTKRVVIISTSENIIDPQDGSDFPGNSVWNAKGQQVVYNGTDTSVTVTNLSPGTNYWIKVYEVYGSDLGTRYNLSSESGNVIDIDSETLPVELSSFTAAINSGSGITLQWITQSETNAYGFYVLRSKLAEPHSASIVSPLIQASNTAIEQRYEFIDETLWEAGTYYYWLQSLDLDGSSELHGPVTCAFDPAGGNHGPSTPILNGISKIYPNPFNPDATIRYELKAGGDCDLLIYNQKGQLVRQYRQSHALPGGYSLNWDGRNATGAACASGVYNVVLVEGDTVSVRKAVLMK